MTNLSCLNFDKIHQLLAANNFVIATNESENFNCKICKKILINPCQVPCGCNFCRKCIENYVNNGGISCPGNTIECHSGNLSQIAADFKLNNQISKLIVKCPEKMCSYECQLINMEEHMRLCSKRILKCPFYKLGCDQEKIVQDELNKHFHQECYNHNKILIGQINELKQNYERSKNEIEVLKKEIQLIKSEKDELSQQIDIICQNLENKINSNLQYEKDQVADLKQKFETKENLIKNQSIELINEKIKPLKIEIEELVKNFDKISGELDNKINVEINARQGWSDKLEQDITKINEKYSLELATKMKELEKYLEMKDNGRIEWVIDNICEIKINHWIYSDNFYSIMNPYKMELGLYRFDKHLCIWLVLSSGLFDADLKWPFQADVKIQITSKDNLKTCKIFNEYCQINKPNNNSIVYSDPFYVYYSDLETAGLMQDSVCCVVKCDVRFV